MSDPDSYKDLSLTWRDFMRQLRRHLLQASITVIVAALLTYMVLEFQWHTHPKSWQVGFSIIVGIICEVVIHTFITVQHQKGNLQTSLDSVEYNKQKSELLQKSVTEMTEIIDGYSEYFGNQLPDMSLRENQFIRFFQQEHLAMAAKLSHLLANGRVEASYQDQLDFASVFAHSAKKYFWATSLDKVSDFQKRNYYYLESLKGLPSRMSDHENKNLPQVARIFVGRLQDFYEEILNDYPKALDLYDWHIRWLGRSSLGYPLRFFAYTSSEDYPDIFTRSGMSESHWIEDFMIIDGTFVYGRRSGHGGELVELGCIDDQTVAQSYEEMYPHLWEASLPIDAFIKKMGQELVVVDHQHLTSFLSLCHKLESKLEIEKDYKASFPVGEQKGASFFNRCCQIISQGYGNCFALDRADKKGGDLIETWQQSPYREFKDASTRAAGKDTEFRRLFIIQDLLSDDVDKISEFIFSFVSSGIQVGFILVTVTGLAPLIEKYDTDFIVMSIKDLNFKDLDGAFGFELQEIDFDVKNLSWDKNLIAKSRLQTHYSVFEKLWAHTEVVRVVTNNPNAIREAAIKLHKEEKHDAAKS